MKVPSCLGERRTAAPFGHERVTLTSTRHVAAVKTIR